MRHLSDDSCNEQTHYYGSTFHFNVRNTFDFINFDTIQSSYVVEISGFAAANRPFESINTALISVLYHAHYFKLTVLNWYINHARLSTTS